MRNRVVTALCIAIVIASLVAGAGCTSNKNNSQTIVTSFYPIEFVVDEIAGDDFRITNITPVGTEPHDLELSPDTTQTLLEAKLVFVVGEGFQPAVEKTIQSREGKTVEVLQEILGDNSRAGVDPHFWLDPILYKKAVTVITASLISINPDKKQVYETRRDDLLDKLDALDESYVAAFDQCATKTFITSHDAFSRMSDRYGLTQESIAGITPENEPSPQRLAELAKLAKDKNVSVIFTEDFVSDKVAHALSDEAGLETQTLSPLEGLSKQDIESGKDYFDVMEENRTKLMAAMGCSHV